MRKPGWELDQMGCSNTKIPASEPPQPSWEPADKLTISTEASPCRFGSTQPYSENPPPFAESTRLAIIQESPDEMNCFWVGGRRLTETQSGNQATGKTPDKIFRKR